MLKSIPMYLLHTFAAAKVQHFFEICKRITEKFAYVQKKQYLCSAIYINKYIMQSSQTKLAHPQVKEWAGEASSDLSVFIKQA